MRNDRNNKSGRGTVVWLVVALILIALFFAGIHLLSNVDLSSLHGG